MFRFARFSLLAFCLLLVVTSCDFNAAEDAVSDFEVLIGLPSLSSVVTVQALDATNGEPISQEIELTFGGTDAGSVVDIYNDPISELVVDEGGFGTFALRSGDGLSPEDPTRVTLRAQADGYNTTTTSVQVTEEGDVSRVIRLTPDDRNPNNAAPGTEEAYRDDVSGGASGGTSSGGNAASASKSSVASASFDIPAGISFKTASDGESLVSPSMALTAFDNLAAAQDLLPAEVKTDENGTHRQLRGAVRFEVRGENAVANWFGTTDSDTTRVTADFSPLRTRTGDPTVTLVNPATGESFTKTLSPANTGRADTEFVFAGSEVIVRSPNGTTTLDRSTSDLEPFQGELFAVVGVDPTSTCSPGALTVNPNGQRGSMRVRISGDGFAVERTVSIPGSGSSFTVSPSSLYRGEIPDLSDVTLSVRTTDGQTTSQTIDPCTESSVTLPAPSANRIDATIRAEADCPAGERVPISPPFDGYSLAYRLEGSTNPYWTVSRDDITINTTDDAKETVTSVVVSVSGVKSGGEYEAIGTFGDRSATLEDAGRGTITMPTEDGGQVIVTDERLSDQCR